MGVWLAGALKLLGWSHGHPSQHVSALGMRPALFDEFLGNPYGSALNHVRVKWYPRQKEKGE
jgi:hypothetical protein